MKNLTLILVFLIGSLSACKKDKTETKQVLSLAEFNAKFSVPVQKFNGTANAAFTVTGTKGIKIEFPANAFLDASGNAVTGSVGVTLKEILSKRDILLSGKMTESNKQLLVSGGEFQILAFQNGQQLKLNPAAVVNVSVPTKLSSEPMDLFMFTGTTVSDSTWMLNQKARVLSTPAYYQFSLPGFGWVNCDYFYNNPNPKTTITASPVYSGTVPNIKDQRAYLIFDNINNVVGLPFEVSINKHQSYLNSMPIGLTGKIVILSVDVNDVIYFGNASFTITSGLNLNIPMAIGDQTTIDNYLNAL